MDKKMLCVFLGVAVCFGLLLFGCQSESTIIFKRDSQAQKVLDKYSKQKQSTGIIDLRDDGDSSKNINFGPGEINFDIQTKFK